MSNQSPSAAMGRARSCTGCRQVKLACDARKTAPQPCTRCEKRGLQCRFDNNFKRIPMRRVAQEITNGLHKLLPTADIAASSTYPARASSAERTHAAAIPAPTIVHGGLHPRLASVQPSIQLYESSRQWLSVVQNDYHVTYKLGNVELDADTVVSLFKHFENHHLPHAPFLTKIESISNLAAKSPLLFWTIILIATREHDQFDFLYDQTSVAHEVLLSQITNVAIHLIDDIHALLLLCLWPTPKIREQFDPSWNYIGWAMNAAMQLSCHRPLPEDSIASPFKGLMTQTSSEIGTEKAALTWIHCFIIGSRLAITQGLPPPLATTLHLRSVTSAINSISSRVTEEQKAVVEILRLSSLCTSEVDSTEDPHTRYSLIQMFDGQFDNISKAYQDVWTSELDIELQHSKLNLYALLLTLQSPDDTNQRTTNRQIILLRMQEAASNLISQMTSLSNTLVEDGFYPAGALTFYPKYYFTSLFMAALSLFRFLASYRGASQQDTTNVVNSLTEAHRILQSFPQNRDAVKGAIHIQCIVGIIRNLNATQPYPLEELVVKHRLGASIVMDAAFRSTHYRNSTLANGASPSVNDWLGMTEDPRNRVPLTPAQRASSSHATSSNHGTDDGYQQAQQSQTTAEPWSGWDTYMNDFEVGLDQWSNESLSQVDSITQMQQMYDVNGMTSLPLLGGLQ